MPRERLPRRLWIDGGMTATTFDAVPPDHSEFALNRIPQLDGLRGMAILLVLIWHYVASVIPNGMGPWADFVKTGLGLCWSGVDLFFVLSGFLIGGILLDHRASPSYFKPFYARRVCRIFPPYFLWLLLFAGVPQSSDSSIPMVAFVTFTQNFVMAHIGNMGPAWMAMTWSLAIEEQFYLTLPAIVRFLAPRVLTLLLVGGIVVTPILRFLLVSRGALSDFAVYVLLPTRADVLLLGVLCADLLRRPRAWVWLAGHRRLLYDTWFVLLVTVLTLLLFPREMVWAASAVYGYTALAWFYAVTLLLVLLNPEGHLARVTLQPGLRRLGLIAYGVYLIHQMVQTGVYWLVFQRPVQLASGVDLVLAGAALVLTLGIAGVSYRVFEVRFIRWGHGVTYEESPRACVQTPGSRESEPGLTS